MSSIARPVGHVGLSVAAVLAGVGLCACGGTSAVTATSAPAITAVDPASARSNQAAGLSFYLLSRRDGTGLKPTGPAVSYVTAAAFTRASGGSSTDTTRLTTEGFTGALRQPTRDSDGAAGVSVVLRLGSPAGARTELTQQLTSAVSVQPPDGTLKRFSITGIPGSAGFVDYGGSEAGGATNVFFTEGRCVIGVGDATSANATVARYEQPVIAAVQAIHAATVDGGGVCTR